MSRRHTLRSLAANPGVFADIESAHDDRLLNEHLDEPDLEPAYVAPSAAVQIRSLVRTLHDRPLGEYGPTDGALARDLARLLNEWADTTWKGREAA